MAKPMKLSSDLENKIVNLYEKTGSVLETTKILKENGEKHVFENGAMRNIGYDTVRKVLVDKNIYESYGEKNLKLRQEKIKRTVMEKYGVENIYVLHNPLLELNKVPYDKIKTLTTEFEKYKDRVNRITRDKKKTLKSDGYCYYTGIRFVDEEQDKVNPNDPRKRTVDHIIPVVECYLSGISPEDAADEKNLVHCLRIVNSYKGNTDKKTFAPIADKIRKILINEGYKSK